MAKGKVQSFALAGGVAVLVRMFESDLERGRALAD
jgi:hypothetical protein